MEPTFFETPADYRAWLEANHDKEKELLVGFYKTKSGKPSITWPESVDQVLCFGWIDGVRRRIDDDSYSIRFTPRKPGSIWSDVNVKKVAELTEQGLMRPAGVKAYEARKEDKSGIYSFEQKEEIKLDDASEKQFRANTKAWEWFQAQAPSYQKAAMWWVISAKKEETRLKRIATLIEDSEHERRIAMMRQR